MKGVTIKDALDAIHKAFKKRVGRPNVRVTCLPFPLTHVQADDELDKPYLAGFEWDKEESWTRLIVHLQTQPTTSGFGPSTGGKKKKKNKEEE